MVKHTQTIRRQIADELCECVWPFCEMAFKELARFFDMRNQSKKSLALEIFPLLLVSVLSEIAQRIYISLEIIHLVLMQNFLKN